jgi:hypothetical protein
VVVRADLLRLHIPLTAQPRGLAAVLPAGILDAEFPNFAARVSTSAVFS